MGIFNFGRKIRRKDRLTEAVGDEFANQLKFMDPFPGEQGDEHLKAELAQLTSVCRALWSFIKEHHDLSEADLKERLELLKQQEEELCTQCGRVVTKSQKRCLYCGAEGRTEELSF